MGKIDAMRMAKDAYKSNEELLSFFDTELQKQQRAYKLLQFETASNPLYAARFAQIVDLTRGLPQSLSTDQSENEKQMKDFIMNGMDIEALYTSGHWGSVWDQWLSWYTYDTDNHLPQLIDDARHLLSRIKSDEVYAALAEQLVTSCEKQNWHDQETELAFYLLNEDRIKEPSGKIESLYTLLRIRKGAKAPDLVQGTLPKKKTILAFYDSGCGNCTVQMTKLAEKYSELKKKGCEVVSISADHDKTMFENYSTKLPWKDKYCDFEGFAGKDFRNYGVMGTPTFYLIDSKGVIQGRYARVEDIEKAF
ncbi:MAG: thioredoxin family protein [Dysgonamonadaceae bacterium]|nr:thioredoxin family protein [Dysgonamonadaceae bacterium]